MKKISYMLILLTFLSCRYFNVSPVNGITIKDLIEKPNKSEMIGIWEVDEFSYQLNEQKGFEKRKIELDLMENGTFKITNLPSYINPLDQSFDKYVTTGGTWSIVKDYEGENWVLKMSYDKSSLYNSGMSTTYDLFLKYDEIIIWEFIGDPDSGERFLYIKK